MDPLVAAEVARHADPSVPFRARPGHTHRTWARTFSSLPELYVQPRSVAEVVKAVDLARACRRRIAVVGSGHSPSNLTCTSSWMVNLDRLDRVLAVDAGRGLVTVEAGMRLHRLCDVLDEHGLAMPNLGSIVEQSVAGAIATGTHGSSLRHGLLSEDIVSLRIVLASGKVVRCSAEPLAERNGDDEEKGEEQEEENNPELFRAATLSLGALGIITEVTIRAVPAFSLRWHQVVDADARMLERWDRDLWTSHEFVRVWWLPHTRRAVVWQAGKTSPTSDNDGSSSPQQPPPKNYFDGAVGYYVYHNLLALTRFVPRLMPWVEWFVCGMQFGFRDGASTAAVQPSRDALLLNCLYSQFVNEWALPLHRGPEAIRRLSSWLNRLSPGDPGYVAHGIPYSAEGVYVHQPLEVRISDTTLRPSFPRPHLDPTVPDGPTLYLNATLYRPYFSDPPVRARFYQAFEHLMRDLGGRPHWAKNFDTPRAELERLFGKDLLEWRRLRDEADPEGMFVGPWHRERVLAEGAAYPLEELETARSKAWDGSILTTGVIPEEEL